MAAAGGGSGGSINWEAMASEAQQLSMVMQTTFEVDDERYGEAASSYEALWRLASATADIAQQTRQLVPLLPRATTRPVFHGDTMFAGPYANGAMSRWLDNMYQQSVAEQDFQGLFQTIDSWVATAPPLIRAILRVPTEIDNAQAYPEKAIVDSIRYLTHYPWIGHSVYESVLLTILRAAEQVFLDDHPDLAVDWKKIWAVLPLPFRSDDDTDLDSYPSLRDFYIRVVLTAEEKIEYARRLVERREEEEANLTEYAEAEELKERVAELEAKLAPLPDPTLVEQAQLYIAALKVWQPPAEGKEEDDSVIDAYEEFLGPIFRSLTLESQYADPFFYLPTLAEVATYPGLQRVLVNSDYAHAVGVVKHLLFRPYKEKWTPERLELYQQRGGPLLRYSLTVTALELPGQQNMTAAVIRYLTTRLLGGVVFLEGRHHVAPEDGGNALYFTRGGLLDSLLAWTIAQAEQALHQELRDALGVRVEGHIDLIAVRQALAQIVFVMTNATEDNPQFLPGLYPKLSALLDPPWQQFRQQQLEQQRARAGQAMAHRLRARRRLSLAVPRAAVPLLPPPPQPRVSLAEELATLSHRRRKRHPSSGVGGGVLTPAAPSSAIRAFLEAQAEQEEAVLSTLPLVSPGVRQWARRRASTRATQRETEETSEQKTLGVSPLDNCVDFATRRCSNATNLAGANWCAVPEAFWHGPVGPGRQCYDIRELLKHFAEQAIDIPSIPRPSHKFSYPDGRAIKEDTVKSMVEVARARNFPVPWELQLYFAGKAVQQQAPKVPLESGRFTQRELERIAGAAPYAAVAAALPAQEAAISRGIRRGYSGFADEGESSEEESD